MEEKMKKIRKSNLNIHDNCRIHPQMWKYPRQMTGTQTLAAT